MYLTPVFWSMTLLDNRSWKWVFVFNPVMNFIELFRGPLYWGRWPSNGAVGGGAPMVWLLACAFAAVSFIVGYTLFDRTKHVLAEVV
jgi:ABC-type polysaccharide/polyol phosphate export permease